VNDVAEAGFTYEVVAQDNGRFAVMLRWEHHPETDRIVADGMARRDEAALLAERCTLAGLSVTDIRRIRDSAVREAVATERFETIY
jgi:hypothetical protein